jgi:hypothetical protein
MCSNSDFMKLTTDMLTFVHVKDFPARGLHQRERISMREGVTDHSSIGVTLIDKTHRFMGLFKTNVEMIVFLAFLLVLKLTKMDHLHQWH